MGSRFDITVPIREHEIELRQREHNIVLSKEWENQSGHVVDRTIEFLDKGGPLLVGSVRRFPWKKKDVEDLELESLQYAINKTFLEKHLEECLKNFKLYDATWATSIDSNFAHVSFTVNANRTDELLNHMTTLGIGQKYDSTLSVFRTTIYYNGNGVSGSEGRRRWGRLFRRIFLCGRSKSKSERKISLNAEGSVTGVINKRQSTNSVYLPCESDPSSENTNEIQSNASRERFREEALNDVSEYSNEPYRFNKQEDTFDGVVNSQNFKQLKIKLPRDLVFSEVPRRNVPRNTVGILESAEGKDSVASRHRDSEYVGEYGTSSREPSLHPNTHHHHTASPGFFGNMFGGFFGPPRNVEVQTVSEDESSGPGSRPSTMTRRR